MADKTAGRIIIYPHSQARADIGQTNTGAPGPVAPMKTARPLTMGHQGRKTALQQAPPSGGMKSAQTGGLCYSSDMCSSTLINAGSGRRMSCGPPTPGNARIAHRPRLNKTQTSAHGLKAAWAPAGTQATVLVPKPPRIPLNALKPRWPGACYKRRIHAGLKASGELCGWRSRGRMLTYRLNLDFLADTGTAGAPGTDQGSWQRRRAGAGRRHRGACFALLLAVWFACRCWFCAGPSGRTIWDAFCRSGTYRWAEQPADPALPLRG